MKDPRTAAVRLELEMILVEADARKYRRKDVKRWTKRILASVDSYARPKEAAGGVIQPSTMNDAIQVALSPGHTPLWDFLNGDRRSGQVPASVRVAPTMMKPGTRLEAPKR